MFLTKQEAKQHQRELRAERKKAKQAGEKPAKQPVELLSVRHVYYLGTECPSGKIGGSGMQVVFLTPTPEALVVQVSGGELHIPWGDVTYWSKLRTADVPGYHGKYAATKVAEYALGGVFVGTAGRREDEANAERSAVALAYLSDGVESMVYLTFQKEKDVQAVENQLTDRLGPADPQVHRSPTQLDDAWWQASDGWWYPPQSVA